MGNAHDAKWKIGIVKFGSVHRKHDHIAQYRPRIPQRANQGLERVLLAGDPGCGHGCGKDEDAISGYVALRPMSGERQLEIEVPVLS